MLTIGAFAQIGQVSPRMLRHYDELGLLRPERVDPETGYRFYDISQLSRLHPLLALRDLGFSLEQIRGVLDDELSTDQLRGMLRLRRAQVEQVVGEEQARLRRIEARLRALEGRDQMLTQDIVVKSTQPLRVAEATGTAQGFGSENLGPVFGDLYPRVIAHLERAGARPGLCVAWYEESDDGTVTVHAGFEINDQKVSSHDEVRVRQLPVVEVVSVVYRGSMDNVGPTDSSRTVHLLRRPPACIHQRMPPDAQIAAARMAPSVRNSRQLRRATSGVAGAHPAIRP
jgi:DNA-binding transcriptional MerR regulator